MQSFVKYIVAAVESLNREVRIAKESGSTDSVEQLIIQQKFAEGGNNGKNKAVKLLELLGNKRSPHVAQVFSGAQRKIGVQGSEDAVGVLMLQLTWIDCWIVSALMCLMEMETCPEHGQRIKRNSFLEGLKLARKISLQFCDCL